MSIYHLAFLGHSRCCTNRSLTQRQIPVQEQVPEEVDEVGDAKGTVEGRAVACAFRLSDSTHFHVFGQSAGQLGVAQS